MFSNTLSQAEELWENRESSLLQAGQILWLTSKFTVSYLCFAA